MNDSEYIFIIGRLNAIWPRFPMEAPTIAEYNEPLCKYTVSEVSELIDKLRLTSKYRPSLAELTQPLQRERNAGVIGAARVHEVRALEAPRVGKERVGELTKTLLERISSREVS